MVRKYVPVEGSRDKVHAEGAYVDLSEKKALG